MRYHIERRIEDGTWELIASFEWQADAEGAYERICENHGSCRLFMDSIVSPGRAYMRG